MRVLIFKQNRLIRNLLAYKIALNLQLAQELYWNLLNLKGFGGCVAIQMGFPAPKSEALYLWFTAGWQQCYRLFHILCSPHCYRNASGLDILLPNFNHFPAALRAVLVCSATKVMARGVNG